MRVPLILFLFFCGCGEDRRVVPSWHGDVNFSTDERAAIVAGEAWLAEQSGRPASVIAWDFTTAGDNEVGIIHRGPGPSGESGLCVAGSIYLEPKEYLDGLAAHELAHCELGFVDGYRAGDTQTDGIMRVLHPMRWTEAEQSQCRMHADRCPSGR